jgi:hypothetical protein
MNKLTKKILCRTRWAYLKAQSKISTHSSLSKTDSHQYNSQGEDAGRFIREFLSSNRPCMISRFGSIEFEAFLTHLNISSKSSVLSKSKRYITGEGGVFWWDDSIKESMANNAGFFPVSDHHLYEFGVKMAEVAKDLDVLGTWLDEQSIKEQIFPKAINVPLMDLEPYYHHNPWSEVLKGKTVLVVHPFSESIRSQYRKRDVLWKDSRILPEFDLKTFTPVQSVANNPVDFPDWFEALSWMQDQISKIDFDVAIIGAGAYGMPLASFVKQFGRQSIHLGGATQILFGIRGRRWDESPFFQKLFNEHWVYPLDSEKPVNFQKVEAGCYW